MHIHIRNSRTSQRMVVWRFRLGWSGISIVYLVCICQLVQVSALSVEPRSRALLDARSNLKMLRLRSDAVPVESAVANTGAENIPPGANTGAGGVSPLSVNQTDTAPGNPGDPGEITHHTTTTTTSSTHSHHSTFPFFTITTPHINTHTHVPPAALVPTTSAPLPLPTSSSSSSSSSSSNKISPAALLFEIVGGILGLAIIISIIRCIYKYRRTPARDRLAAVIDRHHLDRELAEMAETGGRISLRFGRFGIGGARRNSLIAPPPPPYTNAPDYEEVVVQNHDRESTTLQSGGGEEDDSGFESLPIVEQRNNPNTETNVEVNNNEITEELHRD